ncbi:hypothetical protein DL93DRAFT_2063025 [Clavulina sp. PMI_390]|nr:hypothetical protein DL93DRAFT_2063025 [Clavulina sp. PMI_390]
MASIAEIAQISTQKDKAPAYVNLLSNELSAKPAPNVAQIETTVAAVVAETPVVARQVLSELVKLLQDQATALQDSLQDILKSVLKVVSPRGVTFDEQANAFRNQLADILEAQEEWKEAAETLIKLNMDSNYTDEDKLKVYIRVVRLFLEEEESGLAETYYGRAAVLIHSTTDKTLQLQYKLCQARLADFTRKFVDAALRYHELSWIGDIDEEERLQALSAAVTCAVLAPAGPNRSRMLANLYRDERSAGLTHFNILTKMYLDQIIRPAEIKGFEETLRPHQLARIAQSAGDKKNVAAYDNEMTDGEPVSTRTGPATVLDRAVLEHNLLSCSKIYTNITFIGLGSLLDLTPAAAETMARRMIEQKRLKASIDQVERLIVFEDVDDDEGQGKAGGLGDVDQEEEDPGAPYTKQWDKQIRQTASQVESLVQQLSEKGLLEPSNAMAVA